MAKQSGQRGDEFRDRSIEPARRGPPPLPTMKKRQPTVQDKGLKRGPSHVVMWSVVGGIALGAMLLVFVFLRLRPNSNDAINTDQVSARASISPSAGNVEQTNEMAEDTSRSDNLEDNSSLLELPYSPQTSTFGISRDPSSSESTESEPSSEVISATDSIPSTPIDNNPDPEPTPNGQSGGNEPTAVGSASGIDGMIVTAAAQMDAKKYKEAIITLKQASGLFPKEIRADFYLGLMNSGVGGNDLKAAETHFQKVLDRSPGHIASLNNLALVEIKNRKIAAARNFFTLASKQEPRSSEIDQNIGRILNQVRYFEIKNDDLKKLTSLNTNSATYSPKTGWLYMPFDQTQKAHAEYTAFCRNGSLEDTCCSRCGGQGNLKCRTCAGQKNVLRLGSNTETRNLSGDRNMPNVVTMTTPTSAMMTCPNCRGNGRVDCTDCTDGRDPSLHR